MIAGTHAVLWIRQGGGGNDACRFANAEGGYLIDGSATDAAWNVLRYRVRARGDGTTRRARIGAKSRIFVHRGTDDTWTLNGVPVPEVTGAKDIDFGFTPATMTLPIRRLKLGVGEQAEVLAARLDLESEQLKPLRLVYRRTASDRYECENTETGTTAMLKVDIEGIVKEYKGSWKAQT
jgi:hypothetical protein